MFTVRAVTASDLAISPGDSSPSPLLEEFRTRYASVKSRPEWCFVAEEKPEEGGGVIGCVGYRAPQSHGDQERAPDEIILFDLLLPWQSDYLKVGTALLRESLARLEERGVQSLRFEFASADFWDEQERPNPCAEPWRQIASHLGMALHQEKVSFRHIGPPLSLASHPPLVLRSLDEVGQSAYVDAIERVSTGTLDTIDRQNIARFGAKAAAEHFFDSIADGMDYEPRLWKLAYTPDGSLVGLVAPVKMWGALGTLGYIGVVPEQRGKGYVDDLLREGNAALAAEGIGRIVADTDIANVPMQRAFLRAGYVQQGNQWTFRTNIAGLLAAVGWT